MTLTSSEQQVCRSIGARAERLVQELAEHVAIPTGRSYEPGLEEYRTLMARRLGALGAVTELLPGDVRPWWLTLPGEPGDAGERHPRDSVRDGPSPPVLVARRAVEGGPRVLISGHLDTVHEPGGPFRRLTIQEGGRIATGPGAVDMKGGVLIGVTALEVLAEHEVTVPWTFVLNGDEETGSYGSAATLRRLAAEHDIGIALEPALPDGALAIERMGSGHFMIEVHGRSAHVGRAFGDGLSAVTTLAETLLRVAALADADAGRIVNVGPLRGGTVLNAVPDYAACWGNARFVTAEDGEAIGRSIDALATPADALPRIIVHRAWSRPAKPCTDRVRTFAETARQAAADLGQALPFAATGGVCDGNILQAAGLPTLDTLGVRGGHLHRPDEFIELPSLVERCQLLALVLLRIADGRAAV